MVTLFGGARLATFAIAGAAIFCLLLLGTSEDVSAAQVQSASLSWGVEDFESTAIGGIESQTATVEIAGWAKFSSNAFPVLVDGTCLPGEGVLRGDDGLDIPFGMRVEVYESLHRLVVMTLHAPTCEEPLRVPIADAGQALPEQHTFRWTMCCTSSNVVNHAENSVALEIEVPMAADAKSPVHAPFYGNDLLLPYCPMDALCGKTMRLVEDNATQTFRMAPMCRDPAVCSFEQAGASYGRPAQVDQSGKVVWDTRGAISQNATAHYAFHVEALNQFGAAPRYQTVWLEVNRYEIRVEPETPSAGHPALIQFRYGGGWVTGLVQYDLDGVEGIDLNDTGFMYHAFNESGARTVYGIAHHAGHQVFRNITIDVIQNSAPVVDIRWPAAICLGDEITLDANIYDPDGDALTWRWRVSGTNSFVNQSSSTQRVVFEPGYIRVSLWVYDPHGVTILEQMPLVSQIECDAPAVASFDATLKPRHATFTDTSIGVHNETLRVWDLGDGSTSDAAELRHKYSPGTYDVRLTIRDDYNRVSTASQTFTFGN